MYFVFVDEERDGVVRASWCFFPGSVLDQAGRGGERRQVLHRRRGYRPYKRQWRVDKCYGSLLEAMLREFAVKGAATQLSCTVVFTQMLQTLTIT